MEIKLTNDGDLGLGSSTISLPDLVVVVPHVANIFACLKRELHLSNLKYAFSVDAAHRNALESTLQALAFRLPDGVKFYEIDGRRAFDVRGPSGGVVSSCVCYLVIL